MDSFGAERSAFHFRQSPLPLRARDPLPKWAPPGWACRVAGGSVGQIPGPQTCSDVVRGGLRADQRKVIEEVVAHVRSYSERRCGGRRRCIANRDDRSTAVHDEVVDQPPVAIDGLRPDAGRPVAQIRCLQFWDISLGPTQVEPPARGSGELGETRGPIGAGHLPEAFVPQQLEDRGRFDLAPTITLARQREYGIGSDRYGSVNMAREMHTQERQSGLGHRVDECTHQSPATLYQLEIFAPERHYARIFEIACRDRQSIGVKACADHHRTENDLSVVQLGANNPALAIGA